MKYQLEFFKDKKKLVDKLLIKSNKNLSKYNNLPDIHIQSCRSRGFEQYYCFNSTTHTRKYIKIDELSKYLKVIQRDYEQAINKKLLAYKKKLDRICKDIQDIDLNDLKDIYDSMPEQKKQMVIPIIESDSDYIERWREDHKGGQNSFPISGKIYTARGECVRSKSEKILADLFDKYNIPYSYEPRLELENGNIVNPDFVLLNVRLRKTIYWEHLGLIDFEEYASKNLQKLNDYEASGFELGHDLIITTETSNSKFDSRRIEEKIKRVCL